MRKIIIAAAAALSLAACASGPSCVQRHPELTQAYVECRNREIEQKAQSDALASGILMVMMQNAPVQVPRSDFRVNTPTTCHTTFLSYGGASTTCY